MVVAPAYQEFHPDNVPYSYIQKGTVQFNTASIMNNKVKYHSILVLDVNDTIHRDMTDRHPSNAFQPHLQSTTLPDQPPSSPKSSTFLDSDCCDINNWAAMISMPYATYILHPITG